MVHFLIFQTFLLLIHYKIKLYYLLIKFFILYSLLFICVSHSTNSFFKIFRCIFIQLKLNSFIYLWSKCTLRHFLFFSFLFHLFRKFILILSFPINWFFCIKTTNNIISWILWMILIYFWMKCTFFHFFYFFFFLFFLNFWI